MNMAVLVLQAFAVGSDLTVHVVSARSPARHRVNLIILSRLNRTAVRVVRHRVDPDRTIPTRRIQIQNIGLVLPVKDLAPQAAE